MYPRLCWSFKKRLQHLNSLPQQQFFAQTAWQSLVKVGFVQHPIFWPQNSTSLVIQITKAQRYLYEDTQWNTVPSNKLLEIISIMKRTVFKIMVSPYHETRKFILMNWWALWMHQKMFWKDTQKTRELISEQLVK